MQEVGLAEADTDVQEQRIEAGAVRMLGDPPGAGMGEFVWLADDKAVKREARIECTGQFGAWIDAVVRFWLGTGIRFAIGWRRYRGRLGRGTWCA